jgi:hypothetical protein
VALRVAIGNMMTTREDVRDLWRLMQLECKF